MTLAGPSGSREREAEKADLRDPADIGIRNQRRFLIDRQYSNGKLTGQCRGLQDAVG